MSTTLSLRTIISLMCAGQSLLLALALWRRAYYEDRAAGPANRILATLVATIGLALAASSLGALHNPVIPTLLRTAVPLNFAYGPLLFLYVATLLRDVPSRNKLRIGQWLIHFFPLLACTVWLAPYYALLDAEKLAIEAARTVPPADPSSRAISSTLQAVHIFCYLFATFAHYQRRMHSLYANRSDFDARQLGFVRVALVFSFTSAALGFGGIVAGFGALSWLAWAGQIGVVWFLSYRAYLTPQIVVVPHPAPSPSADSPSGEQKLQGSSIALVEETGGLDLVPTVDTPSEERTRTASKYKKSGLAPTRLAEASLSLQSLMAKAKPHLDGTLDLRKLARLSGFGPNHLSQILNEGLGQNFYDFVNAWRVEEAKRLLSDRSPRGVNILQIGYDSGFNSKSTFHTSFTRCTGMTPLSFLEKADALSARSQSEPTSPDTDQEA